MTRHQYYHRPGKKSDGRNRSGAPVSTHTPFYDDKGQRSERPNTTVVTRIKNIQDNDDLRCGYKRMTAQLQLTGYKINAKKVYRLMKTHDQLLDRRRSERGPYVSQRCARPERPLTLLEMDIKMFWVEEHRRHAFVLTIIDTFTRVPQFLATRLREFMADNHLGQVFTHPYTPQENGHVESFHSIISRAFQYERFMTLVQLEQRLVLFYENYNNCRVHSATAMLPPQVFWQAYKAGLITSRKGKRDKLLFSLTVPRYLLKNELVQVKEEVSSMEIDTEPEGQGQPKATAPKQQKMVSL